MEVKTDGETVWLTQQQMADLFGVKKAAISKHIKNIYASGELAESDFGACAKQCGNFTKTTCGICHDRFIIADQKEIYWSGASLKDAGRLTFAAAKLGAAVDIAHVYTNYEIGRMIVEEEQGGKSRADYGKKVLIDLSARLTAKFGRGWSVENLTLMRKFFLVYSDRCAISQSDFTKSRGEFVNGFYEIETTAKYASDLRKSNVKKAEEPMKDPSLAKRGRDAKVELVTHSNGEWAA